MRSGAYWWRSSLKTRITLTTLAIFLTGIWSLAFYASRMLREDMRQLLGEQQFSTVSFMAVGISDELDARLKALGNIAGKTSPLIMGNPPALQKFLEERTVIQSMFNAGLVVFRLDGTAIAEVPLAAGRIGVNYLDVDSIAAALKQGKSTIGRPVLGRKLRAPLFPMTVPIRDARGAVIGALAGVTNLGMPNFLDKITESTYGKSGGYLLVAPQYRQVVTATDKRRIMELLPAPGISPWIDRVVQGHEGSEIFVNPLGVEVLTSVKGVRVGGWIMVVALPSAEVFAPIRAMQQRMLLAALFLTLLAGSLTWWMLRRQLSPMSLAASTLATMSDSSQPPRLLPSAGQDEIGELIGGFNRLLEALGQREEALKQSEARYRLLADQVSDVLWVLNLETGRWVYLSPSVERLRGYSVEEVMAQPLGQVMTAASYADVRARIDERKDLFLSGAPGPHSYLDEIEQTRKDGSTVWTEVATRYTRSERGELTLLGVSRDIGERKRLAQEREQYLRFFLLSIDPMCIADPFGCFKQINPAFTRLTGYSDCELVTKPFIDFVLPEDRQKTIDEMKQQVEVRPSLHFENRYVCKDGKTINLAWTAYFDKNDGVTYATARDITELKRVETALRESETRFRRMFEYNDSVMLLIDPDSSELVAANAAAARFYGYPIERLKTMRIDQINALPAAEVANKKTQVTQHQSNVFVFPHRLASGEVRTVEVHSSPIEVAGRVLLFSIINDITEQERAAAELKRSNAELEQFSYAVSHDMRQPLRMISSYLQLLEMALADKLRDEQREFLDFAVDGAKRLDRMLVELLEYSRVGRIGEPPAWVESRTLLDDALLILQPAAAAAQARLKVTGDWPRVCVSSDEILRLLQNLIENALKFRIAGRTPEITVSSATTDRKWQVSVSDNGVGIIPDQIGRLFQVFQRLQARTAYEGTGVGLALCRKIAEHHGGRIWAESAGVNQGSTFRVELPYQKNAES